MGSIMWGREIAEVYDVTSAERFAPEVLEPAVELLQELANGGAALEFVIGTGRVALPLAARGVSVSGIELSPHMLEQLRAKPGGEALDVTLGDMTTTRVDGRFSLVYLVWNTIMNVTTQDDQCAVFANAAAHLEPGGFFVVEVGVPDVHVLPGDAGRVAELVPDHICIDTFDDRVAQISSSHHWWTIDSRLVHHAAPYRYVWPSELDLMAKLAGFRLRDRWATWTREPFTGESIEQIAVFEKV